MLCHPIHRCGCLVSLHHRGRPVARTWEPPAHYCSFGGSHAASLPHPAENNRASARAARERTALSDRQEGISNTLSTRRARAWEVWGQRAQRVEQNIKLRGDVPSSLQPDETLTLGPPPWKADAAEEQAGLREAVALPGGDGECTHASAPSRGYAEASLGRALCFSGHPRRPLVLVAGRGKCVQDCQGSG